MVTLRAACVSGVTIAGWPIIEPMRRESSTVVVLAGELPDELLAGLARFPNAALVRPPAPEQEPGRLTAAALALGLTTGRGSTYVLVPADPLVDVAGQWQAMWDLSRGPPGLAGFEQAAAAALAAWRAGRFELPDYYLAVGEAAGFYLGPLRAARPHRVAVVPSLPGADQPGPAEQASRVVGALRSLRHGPWWPPLDEIIDTTRRFYPGGLAEAATTLAAPASGQHGS